MNSFEYFSPGIVAYLLFVTAVLGLVMGSFCNAWGWRISNGEKIQKGRSHCTSCGHTLVAKDLVPLFSWVFLKGKCRYCGAPIPVRYPMMELISCTHYLTIVLVYGISWDCLRFLILGSLLLVLSLVDYDTMMIPDGLLIGAAIVSLLRLFTDVSAWKDMLLGLIVPAALLIVVLIMDKIMKKDTMGGGDIKLLAVFGLHFGPLQTVLLLIIACIVGLIAAGIAKKGKDKPFPFGPSLAIASWITAMFGSIIVSGYLSLF